MKTMAPKPTHPILAAEGVMPGTLVPTTAPTETWQRVRKCKGCGWDFVPPTATASRAYCGLCNGLNNDVALWVQAHPPSGAVIARREMLATGRLLLKVVIGAGLFTAFVALLTILDKLVFDWLRLL